MAIAAKRHCKFEQRTEAVDALVLSTFPRMPGVSLLATGGYGRREMFPFSDVDLILLAEKLEEVSTDPVSVFLQNLWDAGLRVSQSVHTVSECLSVDSGNLQLTISLLDQRFLAGDPEPHLRLAASLEGFFRRRQPEILKLLVRLTRERHGRAQNTIFHLEPNLKDGPGGLRDYQVLRWFTRLSGDASSLFELDAPARHIEDLRWLLHELSGRDNNILDFESQDQIASDEDLSPDILMSSFYRSARKIQRVTNRALDAEDAKDTAVLSRLRDSWSRLSNSDFSVARGTVSVRSGNYDPKLLFALVARNGLRLSPQAGRRVHADLDTMPPLTWKELHDILVLPYAALALREMHEAGVLTKLFPELIAIECLVIRDFYHQYTVDEHTLVAITNLIDLAQRHDTPFGELAREHSDLSILIAALLFHDSGKGSDNESHAESSARIAARALTRIDMPAADLETVLFLIRAHLDMSATMNSRDLSEPATLRAMAERVGTVENLKLLALLTYADTSAVNPSAMSPWRASLLWQIYSATYREMMRELQSERLHVNSAFLEGLPVRYLRTHTEEDMQLHLHMAQAGTAVDLQKKGDGYYQLTAVTPDRPALFASIAGAISSFGMNILKAEAFSNSSGTVIDTITFDDPLRTLELNPSEWSTLKETLRRASLGEVDVGRLLQKRPVPRFSREEPRIDFDNEASGSSTLLQIVATDRPGLLYDVASAISAQGSNIEIVLVDTQGRQAIDVFYIEPKIDPASFPDWTNRLRVLLQ